MDCGQKQRHTSVTYNHMNLPILVSFVTGEKITYLYDASGKKLKKTVWDGSTSTPTDYLSGFQYISASLDLFPTAEGYVKCYPAGGARPARYNYAFNLTDHLGNIRLTYGMDSEKGGLVILEENHYYPFRLKHEKYNSDKYEYVEISKEDGGYLIGIEPLGPQQRRSYQYKYNGKEFQDEMGLNVYDYGARFYEPSTGKWYSVDAMAEKYYNTSPYIYTMDNPVIFVDPDGNEVSMCCQGLKDVMSGVYSTLKAEVKETYDFITKDAWKSSTWKGVGNTIVAGVVAPGVPYSSKQKILTSVDNSIGTNSAGINQALKNSFDDTRNKLLNGNTKEKAAAATGIALLFAPSKIDDLGKLGKLADAITGINKKFSTGALKDVGGLEAVISSAAYYEKIGDQGAHIFNSIAGGHVFMDGNKRTASAFIQQYAKDNGLKLKVNADELKNLSSELAKGTKYSAEELSKKLFK